MKIGILTQPLHRNYGGILQNWALQQVLIRMGHAPEMIFIDYRGYRRSWTVGYILRRLMSFALCCIRRYGFQRENVFIQNPFDRLYMPSQPKYADSRFIKSIKKTKALRTALSFGKFIKNADYDAFIVGSDQVWREEYSSDIRSFFLGFLSETDKRKRIAYAASFGKEREYISADNLPACRELLHRFDTVSVREDSGLDILKRDFSYEDGVKVLDPTLLLATEDYKDIIATSDHNQMPTLAAYILDPTEDIEKIAKEGAEERNLKIEEFSGQYEGKPMLSIPQWLAAFANAEFVVTDSFHGMVFSILFNKPFVVYANKERGLDRYTSLLNELGLEDKLVYSYEDFKARNKQLFADIDYKSVNQTLEKRRKDSLKFLTDALA